MIKCLVVLCMVANPTMCLPPIPVEHADGSPITTPMDCARGGFIYSTAPNAAPTQADGSPNQWSIKSVRSILEGDGSDIVRKWVEEEKRRTIALQPQIK